MYSVIWLTHRNILFYLEVSPIFFLLLNTLRKLLLLDFCIYYMLKNGFIYMYKINLRTHLYDVMK